MRLAPFLTLSLALHVGALAYPIVFKGWQREVLIAVTIMPIETAGAGAKEASSKGENPSPPRHSLPTTKRAAKAISERVLRETEAHPKPSLSSALVENTAKTNAGAVALSAVTVAKDSAGDDSSVGSGNLGAGGSGSGSFGLGAGSSGDTRSGQGASAFVQARYQTTPEPLYPADARREGREGRVLLRVLIDEQGRTKTVEIKRSSGNSGLDQAATEAIRYWRFHPARAGEKSVQSWVTVPIDFRLTDQRN